MEERVRFLNQQMKDLLIAYENQLRVEEDDVNSKFYHDIWDQLEKIRLERERLTTHDQALAEFAKFFEEWNDRFDGLQRQAEERIETKKLVLQAQFLQKTIVDIYIRLIRLIGLNSGEWRVNHNLEWLARFETEYQSVEQEFRAKCPKELCTDFDIKRAQLSRQLDQTILKWRAEFQNQHPKNTEI